ncbi:MAG: hypothetical protein ACI4JZ_05870, partial [Oscillospiraceae bacterium]
MELESYTMMGNTDQVVSGEYPDGQRAFKFVGCTYEADISDFKLIDVAGDVCLYYYTGIKVLNESGENKKGYYDRTTAKLKYFWTIAGYNFNTGNYFEVHSQEYYPANGDAGKMSGNPAIVYKSDYTPVYIINVGYFFIKFALYRDDYYELLFNGGTLDDNCKNFSHPEIAIWKLSNDNKKEIREKLGIKGDNNNFCCTDLAVKNRNEEKYAATFMILPTDDNFNQKNVMFEVELKSEVKDNKTVKEIVLRKKESNVKTVQGGNILSSNPTSGNCVYVITSNSKDREKIKFGIDNRDRRTRFEIEIGKTTDENNVLQSFSVKDYTDTDSDGNEYISDEESRLELVFKNRIEYYKIVRKSVLGIIEYETEHLKTYWLNEFCSTYLSSDDIPSILDFPWGVNISSTTEGMRNIYESGNTNWSS